MESKREYLRHLVELWNSPGTRKNWVLRAISDCVLGAAEGFQKNANRHLIKRLLDPNRVDPSKQIDGLILLGQWKKGDIQFPKRYQKSKGYPFWVISFPYFKLVGRGNRLRTVLKSEWEVL